MKRFIVFIVLTPILAFSQQKVTLEDIWSKGTFSPRSAESFNVMKDGKNYADVAPSSDGVASLVQYDLKTGNKVKELVNGNDIKDNAQNVVKMSNQGKSLWKISCAKFSCALRV